MADNDLHYNGNGAETTDSSAGTDSAAFVPNYDSEAVVPLPYPGEGGPVYSPENDKDNNSGSSDSTGSFPAWPMQPQWTQVFPVYPAYPVYPSMPAAGYGQVRFLNASTGMLTVNIYIDGTVYVSNSSFAGLSGYDWVSDGFHTIVIRNAAGLKSVLLQQTFPFTAGQKVTFVITDAASGGLELVRVTDTGCSSLPSGSGCFRFGNMSWSGSVLDLMLGSETVFRRIAYQNVSSYKQTIAGNYQFTAVTASAYSFINELPVILIGASGSAVSGRETVLTFHASVSAGKDYTAYLIGNTWSGASLQVVLAED